MSAEAASVEAVIREEALLERMGRIETVREREREAQRAKLPRVVLCNECARKVRARRRDGTARPGWHRDPLGMRKWCKGSPGQKERRLSMRTTRVD